MTEKKTDPDGGGLAVAERPERPGLALSRAFDELWTDIQANHPELPDCALFVSPIAHGQDTKRFHVLGHFGKERWQTAGGDTVGEVVLVAEHLARGGADVLEVVLHEAAHALAAARGLQDTSQGGRYHNQVFATVARELGLVVEVQAGGRGLAKTSLDDGTEERYAGAVRKLDAAVIAAKAARKEDDDRKKRAGGPLKYECACEPKSSFRMSPSVFYRSPITCGGCQTVFAEAPKKAKQP
jgi:hypothetical protein